MPSLQCSACGLVIGVPAGSRRLCACGAWLVAAAPAKPVTDETALAAIERLGQIHRRLRQELGKIIIGQERVLDEVLIAIFARGHCILEGVPGLAKTLMVRTLADCLDLAFSRIQFTPDLMPADVTGTDVLQEDRTSGQRDFRFLPGPIFANVILADEINRTPPKTQAALLEAMQEGQVTAAGARHRLPDPFFVLATQNPIEQEGTYPLPEAQLDRFMLKVLLDYPDEEEELRIVEQAAGPRVAPVERVMNAADIQETQSLVAGLPAAPHVVRYAVRFTRLTRQGRGEVPGFVRDYVAWGAGPRASQHLLQAARARAALDGRPFVSCADVQAVAFPVLRHRIVTNFHAESENVGPDDIIRRLAELVPQDPAEPIPAMTTA